MEDQQNTRGRVLVKQKTLRVAVSNPVMTAGENNLIHIIKFMVTDGSY
jgi:hypothetical protein